MEQLLRSDYYYDLPEELIAQDPLSKRSDSRLMVLNKTTGEVAHHRFYEITEYLKAGDCLVLNNTKVIPARLLGERENTGGAVEVLLLKRRSDNEWETLVKPGKKARPGQLFRTLAQPGDQAGAGQGHGRGLAALNGGSCG